MVLYNELMRHGDSIRFYTCHSSLLHQALHKSQLVVDPWSTHDSIRLHITAHQALHKSQLVVVNTPYYCASQCNIKSIYSLPVYTNNLITSINPSNLSKMRCWKISTINDKYIYTKTSEPLKIIVMVEYDFYLQKNGKRLKFKNKGIVLFHVRNCARRESGGDVRPSEFSKKR